MILVHAISFVVAASAFYLNKVHAFTGAKNLALWLFTGELFPLDLMPEPLRSLVIVTFSQFMISLQKASTAMLGNLLIGLSWFTYSLIQLPDFQWQRLPWLLFLIPCGLEALYAMRFFMAATAVIFARSENLQFIWFQLYRLGMRPDSIYTPWLKWFLLTALSVILIYLSNRFWKFALRFYSSASS